jgi:hypothetical protein
LKRRITFAYPRWLMQVFRPIVQSLVLSVLNVQSQVSVCRGVALELVGVQYPRCASVLPEKLSRYGLVAGMLPEIQRQLQV